MPMKPMDLWLGSRSATDLAYKAVSGGGRFIVLPVGKHPWL